MLFTWDERKNRSNKAKHGVSFVTATLVFDDPHHLSRRDREVEGELRWHTIGMIGEMHTLLVVHTMAGPDEHGEEVVRIISARKRRQRNGASMRKTFRTVKARYVPGQRPGARAKRELAALAAMPDSQIDLSDAPELPPGAWRHAIRGRFYRPVKQAISLRVDADVVAWLKQSGKGYQTRANRILRERMLAELHQGSG